MGYCSNQFFQDAFTADGGFSNPSFEKRHKFIALSRNVYINEPIHTELSTMNKLIPSHIPIQFRFGINKIGKFLQYSGGDYEIKFSKFYIVYETVDLAPKLLYDIESKFNAKKQGIFPICRGLVKTHQFPSAAGSILWSNLYQGILPETITICMMDAQAYNSASEKNYFNFQNFNLSEIVLKKNSVPVAPIDLKGDFDNNEAKDLYRHFFDNMGIGTSNRPSLISYEDFMGGSLIIPFDLTTDKCALEHNHSKYSGNIDLEIHFDKPLEQGIAVIALSSPDHGYRMYDPRPISDQRSDKKAIPGDVCFFYFRLAPETLNCQILSAALSRTTTNTPSIYQIATSSSIIIAFEELNDGSSDTVCHA